MRRSASSLNATTSWLVRKRSKGRLWKLVFDEGETIARVAPIAALDAPIECRPKGLEVLGFDGLLQRIQIGLLESLQSRRAPGSCGFSHLLDFPRLFEHVIGEPPISALRGVVHIGVAARVFDHDRAQPGLEFGERLELVVGASFQPIRGRIGSAPCQHHEATSSDDRLANAKHGLLLYKCSNVRHAPISLSQLSGFTNIDIEKRYIVPTRCQERVDLPKLD
jgi:hypothetical protein